MRAGWNRCWVFFREHPFQSGYDFWRKKMFNAIRVTIDATWWTIGIFD